MMKFYRNIRKGAAALALFCSVTAMAQSNGTLSIDVSDVTVNSANVTITPSSDDLRYFSDIMTKSAFEAAGGAEKAIENRIAVWERNASWYDNTTWQDMMNMVVKSGVLTQDSYEYLGMNLNADTDYVVYAFGMTKEGDPTTAVAVKDFKTEAPVPSDNTFSISVTSVTPKYANRMTVDAKCVPSNDDTYVVNFFTKATLDNYDLTPGSDGEKQFVADEMLYYISQSDVKSGDSTYSWTMVDGTEYGIVAMGVDENLAQTTPLTIHYFTCQEQTTPSVQGTLTIDVSDVTVNSANVTITPSSDELRYFSDIMTKSAFEAAGGAEKAIENRIAVWERNASWYDNTTWQDMMNMMVKTGVLTQDSYEYLGMNLNADTDYVVYAFGMTKEGEPTTEVAVKYFKTEAPVPSDNTFAITVTSVTPKYANRMTVDAKCVPSNTDTYVVNFYTKELLDKYDLTPGSDSEKQFVADEMIYYISKSDVKSGESTYSWTMVDGTEYGIVAMGVDENLAQTTPLTIHYFTCEETKSEMLGTIELDVTDITPMNAHLKITPSSADIRYFFDVTTAELVERKGGVDAIAKSFVLDWFDFIYGMYNGEVSYAEIVEMQTKTGVIDTMASELIEKQELSDIMWGSDLVLYAVGVDLQGNVVTPTAVFNFTTPEPKQSDLEFEFEFVKAEPDPSYASYFTATVNVYPSREDESFMVNYCANRILDQFDWDDPTDRLDYLQYNFMPTGVVFDQTMQLNFPNLYVKSVDGELQNYYVLAMGWDEGPTTELYKYMFNFETTSLEKVEVNDVLVLGRDGAVHVLGTVDMAAVFSTSGQLMGSLHGAGSVDVPSGVYIVRYTSDGVQSTAKVVVK